MASAARSVGFVLLAIAGVAAAAAAPRLFQIARPALREGLKRGLAFAERAKTAAAKLTEDVEDLVAEVKAELARENPVSEAESGPPAEPASQQPPERPGQPDRPSVRAA
jgi:hypothetical protein